MKTILRISLKLCFIVFLLGCALDGDPAAEPDFLPGVGFGTITPKVYIDLPYLPGEAEQARFLLQAPLLTSFKRNSGIKAGNSYTMPVVDSVMTIEIQPQPGGSAFRFRGILRDNIDNGESGWLDVYYDQSTKRFSFEQCIYVRLDFDVGDYIRAVIHSKGQDIQLDEDGYFHALFDVSWVMYYAAGGDWDLFSATGELYRGILNAQGDIGTGFGFYCDTDSDPASGTRGYVHTMGEAFPVSLGAPPGIVESSITRSKYKDWYPFLSQNSIGQLDNDTEYWAVHCKLDDSDAIFRFDSIDNPGISDYETCLSDVGNGEVDLSTWGSDSLIIPLIP